MIFTFFRYFLAADLYLLGDFAQDFSDIYIFRYFLATDPAPDLSGFQRFSLLRILEIFTFYIAQGRRFSTVLLQLQIHLNGIE